MINIDEENKVVTYENEPNVNRQLFPNIPLTVDVSPLEEEIQELDERLDTAEDDISDIKGQLLTYNGQPEVTSTAAGMTDQDKIYVYTGSETGYTNGDWYYYDGTAWVSGGAYVANPVQIDDTLTQAGEAADAKVTGDEIAQLKSDLSTVDDAVTVLYDYKTLTKLNETAHVYEYTFVTGNTYIIKNITEGISVNLRTCTSDGTEVEVIKNGITTGEVVLFTPSTDASYVRMYSLGSTVNVQIGQYGKALDSIKRIGYIDKGIGIEWIPGYIGSTGNQASATDRSCTKFIPCKPYVQMTYACESNNANVCAVAFYDSNFVFISGEINQGTAGSALTCVSPANTAYFRLSTKNTILSDSYYAFTGVKDGILSQIKSALDTNRVVYVNGTSGNDTTGDGSRSYPFKTITRALQENVYHVSVYPGTYNEALSFDFKGYHIFASAKTFDSLNRPKVVLDGDDTLSCGLTTYYANNLVLEDIVFQNYTANGAYILMADNVKIKACDFIGNGSNGLRLDYVNGTVEDCTASTNSADGFNINYYGATDFINCSGHDNGDDGISHHQGTTGMIIGGEWYNNVKGGIASPCYGARVDIHNAYSHDNAYGIYATSSSADEKQTFRVWNCVLTDNSEYGLRSTYNDAIIYGCKISGNTTGQTIDTNGSITVLD